MEWNRADDTVVYDLYAFSRPRHLLARVGFPLARGLQRRFAGVRLPRSQAVFEALVPVIIEQKVIGLEARRSYRALLQLLSEPAPGPLGLQLPPAPERVAAIPYWDFHPLGIERRPAQALKARDQPRIRRLADFQLLFFGDPLVNTRPNHTWFPEHTIEPGSLTLANPFPGQPHQPFDDHLQQKSQK